MVSIKLKFRPSTIDGKEGTIYYQVIKNRVVRRIKTDYRIFTSEWNDKSCKLVFECPDNLYHYSQNNGLATSYYYLLKYALKNKCIDDSFMDKASHMANKLYNQYLNW